MFASLLRSAAAVLAGFVIAFIGVVGVELMSSILHPLPPGTDPNDFQACCEHVARYPAGVLLLCGVAWWLVVFLSCWVATRLGTNRHLAHGIVLGLILLALAVFNMSMLPYPGWFWINVVTFPACSYLGSRLGSRRVQSVEAA